MSEIVKSVLGVIVVSNPVQMTHFMCQSVSAAGFAHKGNREGSASYGIYLVDLTTGWAKGSRGIQNCHISWVQQSSNATWKKECSLLMQK